MPRKIEVELTSDRGDGTWTWRAAGARQPKGELPASLLHPDAKVGDVVRAEADFEIDGITVTSVAPIKARQRTEPERIEILGPADRDDRLVTTTLAPKGRGGRGDRDRDRGPRSDRGPRRDRPDGDRRRGDRARADRNGDRPRGDQGDHRRGDRRGRPARPAPEPKPKPKRLRAGRTHRNEALAALPPEHRPIAEHVLRGGVPGVRQAVDKQNEAHREAGKPEVNPAPIVALAEELLPALRAAEWHDRAEAALAAASDVDLRDLRSVVVAADDAARDETTRDLADALRAALTQRVEDEHRAWLAELTELLDQGRVVRALRLSSRPPKAGTPLPTELANRLAEGAASNLTAETGQDRFATVLDALAYSPVRAAVTAQGLPAEPSAELIAAVKKLGSRIPQVAAQFGVTAEAPRRRRGGRGSQGRQPGGPKSVAPKPGGAKPPRSESTPPQPAVAEPAVAEPAVAEPAVAQPAVAEPAVAETAPQAAEPPAATEASVPALAVEPAAASAPEAAPEPEAGAMVEAAPAAEADVPGAPTPVAEDPDPA